MMTYLPLTILAVIVILVIFYLKGRGKGIKQKSSSEKIAHTLKNKLEKGLSDIAEGMRDPETIKNELTKLVDDTEKELKTNYATYLKNLLLGVESLANSIKSLTRLSENSRNKAKTIYEEYKNEETQNPEKLKLAQQFMSQAISSENKIQEQGKKKIEMENLIKTSEYLYEIQLSKLAEKRGDIAILVYTPDVNLTSSFSDINELLSEFDTKIKHQKIDAQVKNTVNRVEDDSVALESKYSESELNAALDDLLVKK